MELSVIIVSYKDIQILRDCLNSIKEYNDIGDELEVIVSDNSPDTILYETIKKEYEWVKIIKNENKGFGAGNNRGYEISTGKYLLFLNPDTVLVEPIFKFTIKQFEKDENLALFGVQLLRKDLKKTASYLNIDRYGIFATLTIKFYRKINKFKDGKMFISGADLFVRREAFEQAGKFDEGIFMYKEESDLIKRIKLYATATKTAFFKAKKIVHIQGGTEEKTEGSLRTLARLLETELYYSKKWELNPKKVLKQKRRYQKFKKFIYFFLCQKEKVRIQNLRIELFDSFLKRIGEKS